MQVFKSRWFQRFAKREGISGHDLLDAVQRAERGLVDADLGGEVIKQRLARPGHGRSGGYRTIILLRRGERAFFVYGFAKSDRQNISKHEAMQFREAARHILSLSSQVICSLVEKGDFVEVRET